MKGSYYVRFGNTKDKNKIELRFNKKEKESLSEALKRALHNLALVTLKEIEKI